MIEVNFKFQTPIFLDGEAWACIEGHPSYYVSTKGRLYRISMLKDKTGKRNGKGFIAGHISAYGYKLCSLGNKSFRVHRLVAKAFIPNPENKPDINHIDGNKLNNCVENLEWVTSKENIHHALESGLCNKSLVVKHAKEIQRLVSSGMWQKDVAKLYNCTQSAISRIVNLKSVA